MVVVQIAVLALALGVVLPVPVRTLGGLLVPALLVVTVVAHILGIVFPVSVRAPVHIHSFTRIRVVTEFLFVAGLTDSFGVLVRAVALIPR